MKHIASLITTSRIVGALVLLFIEPLSTPFFVVYILCCASDVIDGYVARKTNTASRFGEILDSAADFLLVAVMGYIFIPLLVWEQWMLYWIGMVAVVRFTSLSVGFAKYRALAFLHTYANKAAGIACACFPFLYQFLGLSLTVAIVCAVASLSAFEELSITISSKELNRNRKSVFKSGSGHWPLPFSNTLFRFLFKSFAPMLIDNSSNAERLATAHTIATVRLKPKN